MSYINFLLASRKSDKRDLHLWAWHYDGFYSTVAKQLVLDTKKKKKGEREKENEYHQNLMDGAKEVLRGKFITINVYIKKKRTLSDTQPDKEPEK